MKLTGCVALSIAAAMLASLAAQGQQLQKIPRLAWLQPSPPTSSFYPSFYEGLRELGYVEGKNIEIVSRLANWQLDRLPELARELVALNVDALLTSTDQGLRAAKEATPTIPIVVFVCDSLDSLVASLARPGGKATGLTCISSELAGKRLQLFEGACSRWIIPAMLAFANLLLPAALYPTARASTRPITRQPHTLIRS